MLDEEIIDRFSGLIDEETLEFLILYSLNVNSIEGVVKSLRLHENKKGFFAVVNLRDVKINKKLDKKFNIESINVIIKSNVLNKITKTKEFSKNSKVKFNGYFSGEFFQAEDFEVISRGSFDTIEGYAIASGSTKNWEFTTVINSEQKCIVCLNVSNIKKEFIKVEGTLTESEDLIIAKNFYIIDKKFDEDIYTAVSKIKSVDEFTRVCISGRVSGIGELREYKGGKFASLYVSDKTDRVRVVLWGENVSAYKEIDVGTKIDIIGGKVCKGEVHCDSFSIVRLETVRLGR